MSKSIVQAVQELPMPTRNVLRQAGKQVANPRSSFTITRYVNKFQNMLDKVNYIRYNVNVIQKRR